MTARHLCFADRVLLQWLFAAASTLAIAPLTDAAPAYSIAPLGLAGLEHTRNDGYKYSEAEQLNELGKATGYSQRYNGGSGDLGRSAWLYDGATTIDIGLTLAEHTRQDGYKDSQAVDLNAAGQVSGNSHRYFAGSTDLGRSAWLYNGATTLKIGLFGGEHTRNDGYRFSEADELNEAGRVIGVSYRYNAGSGDLGHSAWLYNGAITLNIGLTGAEYTRNDGYKYSNADELNDAGQVVGFSNRYNGGSSDLGASSWFYDGATTHDIGLIGAEYTRTDGYKYSIPRELNQAGQVSGYADRYNGSNTNFGRSGWLYNGTTTINIGLSGAEYTRGDGYQYSDTMDLNKEGRVTGVSYRFNGDNSDLGRSAWLYNGTATINIGLTGAEHTRDDGYRFSNFTFAGSLNKAGQVAGVSNRYNGGSTDMGRSAWLYNGATTTNIGLTGAEHTRGDGYKFNTPILLNEAGQVAGYSSRYSGSSADLGLSAWLYNGTTTVNIGLTGANYTRDDGYKYSETHQLNGAGQVAGIAYRYNGGSTDLGQDAWLYDPVLHQTFALNLSTRNDGYAYSTTDFLGEDGLSLGTYTLFDALGNNLGDRAYSFTVTDGLHDLGSLVAGGLAVNGWDWLASAIRANGLDKILGHGKLTSQSGGQMAYLLTPIASSLPGDYNQDGKVNAADFVVWRDKLGSVTALPNDDTPGVGPDDYTRWRAHFGQMAGSGAMNVTVPEPQSVWLVFITAIASTLIIRGHRVAAGC